MSKAIAITAVYENPYRAAAESAVNFAKLVADFMYGTPERVKVTYLFAFSLAVLGMSIKAVDPILLQVCPI